MKLLFVLFCAATAHAQSWIPQTSGTTASLRGVSAVNAQVVWASGSAGTYLITRDGGTTWRAAQVPGAPRLDFRAVWAFDEKTAFLLSIGTGDQSRIYKTTDSGANWTLLFTNPDAKGFFDGIAFWDRDHGIVAGDPVDGHTVIFATDDGGERWQRQQTAPAAGSEGAFAASNTSLALAGEHEVWLGTTAAHVLHSKDNGRTWTVAQTPVRNDSGNAGVFSVAFSDPMHGIAVGGDYSKAADPLKNIAANRDAVQWIGESHGEHSCAPAIVTNGRLRGGPCAAVVFRMEHVRGGCSEPDFMLARERQAGVAGGECAFASRRGRGLLTLPVLAAIIGSEDYGMPVHRISRDNSVITIPESDAIEEAFGIGIGKEQHPMCA